MADATHIGLLRQGIDVWNGWRTKEPLINPNLSGADLRRADLRGADLHGADLTWADLRQADLRQADLHGADLRGARMPTPQMGTLQIQLAETISAYQLQGILALVGQIYFDALWLRLAEDVPSDPFPDDYTPTENDELWINRLEIGTPNLLELLGQTDALTQVAAYLTTVLGGAVAGTKALDNLARFRKTWLQGTRIKKAMELGDKGKISHAREPPPDLEDQVAATASAVKPQPFKVVPAPAVRTAAQSHRSARR